jgi:hypothetical protein
MTVKATRKSLLTENNLRRMIIKEIRAQKLKNDKQFLNEALSDYTKSAKAKIFGSLIALMASYNLLNPDMSEQEIKDVIEQKIAQGETPKKEQGKVGASTSTIIKSASNSEIPESIKIAHSRLQNVLGTKTGHGINYIKNAEKLGIDSLLQNPGYWEIKNGLNGTARYFDANKFSQVASRLIGSKVNSDEFQKTLLDDADIWEEISNDLKTLKSKLSSTYEIRNAKILSYLSREESDLSNRLYWLLKISSKGEEAWNSQDESKLSLSLQDSINIAEKMTDTLRYVAKQSGFDER